MELKVMEQITEQAYRMPAFREGKRTIVHWSGYPQSPPFYLRFFQGSQVI